MLKKLQAKGNKVKASYALFEADKKDFQKSTSEADKFKAVYPHIVRGGLKKTKVEAKKVGRPKKTEAAEAQPAKKKVGRPRKTETAEAQPTKKVGRPRKVEAAQLLDTGAFDPSQYAKRKVGRPRKVETAEAQPVKRKVGRPRKVEAAEAQPAKRKVGRPRKVEAQPAGRPSREDRPSLREALTLVMGGNVMDSAELMEGLGKKGWTPVSEDPRQAIIYTLVSNKNVFERVERGRYRVRPGVAFQPNGRLVKNNGKPQTVEVKPEPKVVAEPEQPKIEPKSEAVVQAELSDLGIKDNGGSQSNPYL
jgi:hypothetical protein